MAQVAVGSLPFREQIAFFRGKQNLGTRAWTDIWQQQHDHAFVVAGAMKAELLNDLRGAVDKVIADGVTLQQFRKDFDEIVAQHGWNYNGGRNWRTRVIYDTNLRTSYQAGRYAQLKDPDLLRSRPYWQYNHSDLVEKPRAQHLAWDGMVLRHDDPFWDTHYPPNGWGCKCSVRPISERQLSTLGKSGPDQSPRVVYETKTVGSRGPTPRTVQVPKGIDPGWAYAPGQSVFETTKLAAIARLDQLPADIGAQMGKALPLFGVNIINEYKDWLTSIERKFQKNESMIVGVIKPGIIDKIPESLMTASVTVIDKQVLHMSRDAKSATTTSSGSPRALTIDEIERLPIIIDQYDALFWDVDDPALLFVKKPLSVGRDFSKVIVRVNFEVRTVADKSVMTNSVRSGGFVDKSSLLRKRYQLLDGEI